MINPGTNPAGYAGQRKGLVSIVPASAMVAAEQEAAQVAFAKPAAAAFEGIAGYLWTLWEEAKQAKQPIEAEMMRTLRQRRGEYEPDVLAEINKFGGTVIYVRLTDVKCRAAEAWIRDILMPAGDRPWTLDPTPVPDISPAAKQQVAQRTMERAMQMGMDPRAITQEAIDQITTKINDKIREDARAKADAMADKIEDQLVEGGWRDAFKAAISDIVTFKAGIMKGPVMRRRKRMVWVRKPNGGFGAEVTDEVTPHVERRSPWDIYPSPHARGIDDGYLFDRYAFTREDIESLRGVEGYNEEAIDACLREHGQGGLKSWLWTDMERDRLEQRYHTMTSKDGTIEALNFWGSVQGLLLLQYGAAPEKVPDPLASYQVEVWMVGRHILRADVNPDPMGRKPYSKASFFELAGSWWGSSPPEQMEDCQRMVNAAARAMANNMAIASGPMAEVHADRFADGENGQGMHPWRIFYMKSDPTGSNRNAVNFFQPNMNIEALSAVIEKWERKADDVTGIPAYSYGNAGPSSGAGSTASGLSMLFSAASKGIKGSVANIDIGIIEPMVQRYYEYNMLFGDDDTIKGDLRVVPRGAAAMIVKEQMQIRRSEFLQTTANPFDMAIIGKRGRAALLRENARALDIPPDDIVPPDGALVAAEMAEKQAMQQQAMQQQQPGAPRTIDPAGAPAGGGDAALFQARAQ